MMKKLLVLVMVLALTSVASAWTVWFEVDSADVKDSYEFSDVITINLVADADVHTLQIGAITSDNGGTAQDPLVLNAKFSVLPLPGTIVNAGDPYVLIELISGSVPFGAPLVLAGEVLYSFDFHVPDLPYSSYITIDDYVDMGHDPPYMTYIGFGDWTDTDQIEPVVIHVVPEPTTIALLGLGGLFLLRRRK
jgi:hypothetical protein